ncbi:MAG: hypothetical protein AB1451_09525 [Nitrospirota bacterium]
MRLPVAALGLATLVLVVETSWAADTAPTQTRTGGSSANVERFLMEGTEIQGTLEKPHVVYVVPWKDTSAVEGDIPLRRSFQQELLEPVDRARFQRQLSQGTSNATRGGLQ